MKQRRAGTEKQTTADQSEFAAPFTFPIEAGKIREFARATADDNPAYYSKEAAELSGFADVPAPPTFAMAATFFQTPESRVTLNIDFRFALHGEQEFEYLAPIVAGDLLTGRTRITDQYEREGNRGGKMIFIIIETRYENQQGSPVLNVRQTLIQPEGVIEE